MNVIIEEVVSEFPVVITEEVIHIQISGSVSYFDLVEVSDNNFVGKNGYIPTVDEVNGKIVLQPQSGGGSSLELGETSTTAYRGDRGKTAYEHSQFNGNPHGTTASQVGAYSQAETDALITNNIKVWKSGINGATVANTLTITPTYAQLIPANTFQSGDVVELDFRTTAPGAKTSASNNYVYLNTTSDLITGSPLQLAIYTGGATSRTMQLERRLSVKGATTRLVNPAGTLASDIAASGAILSTLTIDWTIDQYLIFAIGHTVADQTLTGDFYRIIKN